MRAGGHQLPCASQPQERARLKNHGLQQWKLAIQLMAGSGNCSRTASSEFSLFFTDGFDPGAEVLVLQLRCLSGRIRVIVQQDGIVQDVKRELIIIITKIMQSPMIDDEKLVEIVKTAEQKHAPACYYLVLDPRNNTTRVLPGTRYGVVVARSTWYCYLPQEQQQNWYLLPGTSTSTSWQKIRISKAVTFFESPNGTKGNWDDFFFDRRT